MGKRSLWKKLFYEYKWICGYRILKREDSLPFLGNEKYKLITVSKNAWVADPFLAQYEDKIYAFVEYTDCKKTKSVIGVKQIYPIEEKQFQLAYEFDGHTSYPCVFSANEKMYMITETSAENCIYLLECVQWPNMWEKKVILDNIKAVDSTVFRYEGELYIFIYRINQDSTNSLMLGELDVNSCKILNLREVKCCSKTEGRPAGNVFMEGNQLYRPVQPSKKRYGEKIEFYKFRIDGKTYSEELHGELLPEQVEIESNERINGIHTINRIGNVEIIDMRTYSKFSVLRPAIYLLKKMGLFGYGLFDNKKKKIGIIVE